MAFFDKVFAVGNALAGIASQAHSNRENVELMRQANEFNAAQANTAYQRAVADMRAAGLNPGMMFGQGSMSPSASASMAQTVPNVKGMEYQNVLNNLLARKQIGLLDAQRANVEADTNKKNAETELTQAQKELQSLIAKYYPQLTEAQIADISAHVGVNASTEALNNAHRITQELEQKWIPFLRNSQKLNLDADTALKNSERLINEWTKKYMDTYGVRPGDSEIVDLASFLSTQLGISSEQGLQRIVDFIKDVFDNSLARSEGRGGSTFDPDPRPTGKGVSGVRERIEKGEFGGGSR